VRRQARAQVRACRHAREGARPPRGCSTSASTASRSEPCTSVAPPSGATRSPCARSRIGTACVMPTSAGSSASSSKTPPRGTGSRHSYAGKTWCAGAPPGGVTPTPCSGSPTRTDLGGQRTHAAPSSSYRATQSAHSRT